MNALLLFLLLQAGAVPRVAIAGTVIDSGAVYRQPLFHARVELTLIAGTLPSPVTVRTDLDGRFVFPDLAPGRYRLTATRDGFLRKTATVVVTAGVPRNDIVIGLDVAPTIIGRVKDQYNIPIANLLVEAMRVVYGPRGDRSVATVESALSDDRGEFHLYWLDPGDYFIRASPPPPKPEDPVGLAYAPTYYPGFRDPKDATKIALRVGARLSAFDFKIQSVSPVSMRGRVSIETTGIGVGTTITMSPAGTAASSQQFQGKSTNSSPDISEKLWGDFQMRGMPPGTYVVSAQYVFGGQRLEFNKKVTLRTIEPSFTILLSPGSPVSGQIVSESGGALDLRSARVAIEPTDPDLPSPQPATVNASGQFTAARVAPGDYAIRIPGLPGDAYVKTAKSGDLDILARPLRMDYTSPAPIRVVIALDGGRLDGVVLDNTGRPFVDAQVVLVPDASRRNFPDQYLSVISDDDGRFNLRGIPPGEYKLFAWEGAEPNAYLDQSYIEGFERLGMPVTIPPGSVNTTSVRTIPLD